MNIKQGFKRTAIVIAIFWVVGWSYVAWSGNQEVDYAMEQIAELKREHPKDYTSRRYMGIYYDLMATAADGSEKVAYAVRIGLFGPLALLILSPFGWFIYRGFKPKRPPQPN